MTLRAVFDTNVLVAAFSISRGASFALLDKVMDARFVLLASPALWLEYEAVLKRPEIRKLHRLTLQDIDDAGGSLSEAQLRGSYNDHEIGEVRVRRLVQARQLVERNGRLFIGSRGFLWLAYLIDGLRLIVFGRAGGPVVR